jgi:putative transposase
MEYSTEMDEASAVDGIRKTFKYKLLPTDEQEQTLLFVLRRCRELYHAALQERRDAWQKCEVSITCARQSTELPGVKAVRPEYHDIHSQVLQDVLTRLDRAFQAFFRRVQSGEQPGYPRFQGANRYQSFTYKQFGNGASLDNGDLVLVKIGRIPLRWSRPLPLTGQATGIDVGLKVFLITAEGEPVENPRYYRKAERELKKAQRRVSRRKKGSKRRKKAVQLLARKHQKVRRQRQDFHRKIALALLRAYDMIYLEDLQVANMVSNPHLSKSISDAGWAQFRTILEGKAAYAGRRVVAVPPAYTSQDCSGCGTRVEQSFSVRTHVCPSSGLILDRDENAASNIQRAGQALQGLAAEAVG